MYVCMFPRYFGQNPRPGYIATMLGEAMVGRPRGVMVAIKNSSENCFNQEV